MDIWKELFGTIGWWVLPLMAITWAIREWWGLKKHEKEERKSELVKLQFEKIKAYRAKLITVEELLHDLYYIDKPIGIDPPQVDIRKVLAEMRALKNLARELEVYFSSSFKEKSTTMVRALEGAVQALEHRQVILDSGGRGSEEEENSERRAFELLQETVPIVREAFDKEIRNIIGTK
ncbi:MAG: hypothetical protein KDC44_23640 [Phaeodactylibacter sp.]|nr:hypothetical protein [Phaeodactylibacter sp.]